MQYCTVREHGGGVVALPHHPVDTSTQETEKKVFLFCLFIQVHGHISSMKYLWRAFNYIDLNKEQSMQIVEILTGLEELDDVQNIFTNANLKNFLSVIIKLLTLNIMACLNNSL